jgi:hypothetical protein
MLFATRSGVAAADCGRDWRLGHLLFCRGGSPGGVSQRAVASAKAAEERCISAALRNLAMRGCTTSAGRSRRQRSALQREPPRFFFFGAPCARLWQWPWTFPEPVYLPDKLRQSFFAFFHHSLPSGARFCACVCARGSVWRWWWPFLMTAPACSARVCLTSHRAASDQMSDETVILLSSDAKQFTVLKRVARMSKTLKDLLEDGNGDGSFLAGTHAAPVSH